MSDFRVGDRVRYQRPDGSILIGKVTDLCWMADQIRHLAQLDASTPAGVALAVTYAIGGTSLIGREIAVHIDKLEHID